MPSPGSLSVWQADQPTLAGLYRLARLYSPDPRQPLADVQSAFRELCGKPEARESHRCALFLFLRLRRKICRREVSPAEGSSDALRALCSLPEPLRMAAALFYCTDLPPADIARTLGVKTAELARQLSRARSLLHEAVPPASRPDAPPPAFSASESALFLARPSHSENAFPSAENSIAGALAAFDRHILPARLDLEPTPEAFGQLDETARNFFAHPFHKLRLCDPALLAVAIAFVLLVAIAFWLFRGPDDSFAGEKEIRRLLAEGPSASAAQYEPVAQALAGMGDWLALNGIEKFWVPPAFLNARTAAARVFLFENSNAAAILLPAENMIAYLLDASALDIDLQPRDEWKFVRSGEDSAALMQNGGSIFLVAFRGDIPELQMAISKLQNQ